MEWIDKINSNAHQTQEEWGTEQDPVLTGKKEAEERVKKRI
jgi:hypothetical protein